MQIQNIRDLVRRAPDILGRHEQIQPYGNCNRAGAQALVVTKAGHRYKVEVVAAYATQEPIGQVLVRGPGDYRVVQGVDHNGQVGPQLQGSGGEAIRGPMKEETWNSIIKFIRDHENGEPQIPPLPDPTVAQVVPADDPTMHPADEREPRLGETVLFLARPGEGYRECVAVVTRVHSPVLVDLLVMAPGHQPIPHDRMMRRTPRNDRHVWDFATSPALGLDKASMETIAAHLLHMLPPEFAGLAAELADMRKRLDDLEAANGILKGAEDADRDALRREAEDLGITVDRRWGPARLRQEMLRRVEQGDAA